MTLGHVPEGQGTTGMLCRNVSVDRGHFSCPLLAPLAQRWWKPVPTLHLPCQRHLPHVGHPPMDSPHPPCQVSLQSNSHLPYMVGRLGRDQLSPTAMTTPLRVAGSPGRDQRPRPPPPPAPLSTSYPREGGNWPCTSADPQQLWPGLSASCTWRFTPSASCQQQLRLDHPAGAAQQCACSRCSWSLLRAGPGAIFVHKYACSSQGPVTAGRCMEPTQRTPLEHLVLTIGRTGQQEDFHIKATTFKTRRPN